MKEWCMPGKPGDLEGSVGELAAALGVLWGKSASRAGGRVNLLLSHLLDTAAVAELIWDRFLAPSTRRSLDELAGGSDLGKRLFCWLCGVHDVGKATPPFQQMDRQGAQAVQMAGLTWRKQVRPGDWRHDRAGGRVIIDQLDDAGWVREQVDWVWPLVAGHHGLFPDAGALVLRGGKRGLFNGDQPWETAQRALLEAVTRVLGFVSVAEVQPVGVPSRATQLQLSGLIVMADWIASDEKHFRGVDDPALLGMDLARGRAAEAWRDLGLRGGWGKLPVPGQGVFRERFGQQPRPSQAMVLRAAHAMAAPGLLIVEAPMGEGKTKAALGAAEVLAARFGADGVFMGMPTQATCDPMFTLMREWVGSIDSGLDSQVALLHGKSMFNPEWKALREAGEDAGGGRFAGVDEFGLDCCDDPYGAGDGETIAQALAGWFLGRHRGLLAPFVVGTIDQLLFAATRTRHVMLRMAGLAGKVVVLDEVHAVDVYMSQFLHEAMRWLGQAGVPVVMLSATLAPQQRRALVGAYLAGASSRAECDLSDWVEPQGYPCTTSAWWDGDQPRFMTDTSSAWRELRPADGRPIPAVRLEVLPETVVGTAEELSVAQSAADAAVTDLLGERLVDGGCALVIRNTVARAQSLTEALRARFDHAEVQLLHGRLTTQARADRTRSALDALGPARPSHVRPGRLVLVATQLAEQSFDVDADLLITDLTTADLQLQRIGRLHRHVETARPARLRKPCVVVTGFAPSDAGPPDLPGASEAIYGRWPLLRTAAMVEDAASGDGWRIPVQVPELVGRVYDGARTTVFSTWRSAEDEARLRWERDRCERVDKAAPFLLTRLGEHENPTLDGLHFAGALDGGERRLQALVRDGEPSVEAVLVVGEEGGYRTLAGRKLTVNGDVASALLDEVLGATVRLSGGQSRAAHKELAPLPGWLGDPWLRYSPALVLDDDGRVEFGGYVLRYDSVLGLVQEMAPGFTQRPSNG
ncbi:CRISPR-associated helicase Cas3' [Embleya sp. NPDC056575]|uniref:CRISPR-associated helicase Cas3' n=1 Tax=unclassified Embleya TaxID=2699296 RepID=UPI0036B34DF8